MITNDPARLITQTCVLLGKPAGKLKLMELGNQWTRGYAGEQPFKPIAQWLGFDHTSIDLNGKDGAMALNLGEPIGDYLLGQFDIVTNYGTTEHVHNSGAIVFDQWQVFKNIHDLLKPTGVIIHVIPNSIGAHWGSCAYAEDFLSYLASSCNYELVEFYKSTTDENHNVALMLKNTYSNFINILEFSKLGIIKP